MQGYNDIYSPAIHDQEGFEDTKGAIKIRMSKLSVFSPPTIHDQLLFNVFSHLYSCLQTKNTCR